MRQFLISLKRLCFATICMLVASLSFANDASQLTTQLVPLWECISGARESFLIEGSISIPSQDGRVDTIAVRLERFDAHAYDVELTHADYALNFRRRSDATAMALPKHGVVYLGAGNVDSMDHLDPLAMTTRLVSSGSMASLLTPLLSQRLPTSAAALAIVFGARYSEEDHRFEYGNNIHVSFGDEGRAIDIDAEGVRGSLILRDAGDPKQADDWSDMRAEQIPRIELERQLARGVKRALEIISPSPELTSPEHIPRSVEHGNLQWMGGHRVVTLHGTPEQIGKAHGELMPLETHRCIDSVLNVFGTIETIRSGEWFRKRLDDAYSRLSPHIPERHKQETRALAKALNLDASLVEVINVFPELFHCSGFALFGSATKSGTLYHGRVLDYMTVIGLQDAATSFVIAPEGFIPFVNVGYAGFIGSVSGMNTSGISLGEMGGQGEGQWDGVPMATLMRRALEECTTLDDVTTLWETSPRTCEYYYVFADGKSRRAVGVAATPTSLEIIQPGQSHARLGDGITDAVVLSAGERLETLRNRVLKLHGSIDAQSAMQLMNRPVAMKSNLHNVLFIPEELVLHIANASHDAPAAECPYVRLDLEKLLLDVPHSARSAAMVPLVPKGIFPATDSIASVRDENADAQACLDGLLWNPERFDVVLEDSVNGRGDFLVRFPSPKPGKDSCNDNVWLEWYVARDESGERCRAPAVVIVHESGSGMDVGRLIARGLNAHHLHTFLIHLPFYGQRRPSDRRAGAESLIPAVCQAVADVRRARDAVAVLPGVHAGNIAVQGTSLGGFVTATAAGIDHGFDSVYVLLAGGDLSGILENGRKDAKKVREHLSQSGMTWEKICQTLYAIEPMRLAHRLNPDRTWIYSGRFDDVVPPRNSKLLADAAGLDRLHHKEMYANHYSGIVFLPMVLAEIHSHITQEMPEVLAP